MRSPLVAIALFATACASAGGVGSEATTTTFAPPPADFTVTIDQTGGCMMMGPNCVRYAAASDGAVSVYRLGGPEAELIDAITIDQTLVDDLSQAVAATDLDALRSRLGPGECRGCYDGIDTEVTFVAGDAVVTFSSVDVEFDPSEPVFAALEAVIAAVSVVEIPLEQHGAAEEDATSAEIYATTVKQIVEVDNTFGGSPIFSTILVVDSTDPTAGDPVASSIGRPLTDTERATIMSALGDTIDVQFIADAGEYRTADLMPTLEDSAIVTVGEIEHRDGNALVGMSLWCGGLCGIWLTYRVVMEDTAWVVDGIEGPMAIS